MARTTLWMVALLLLTACANQQTEQTEQTSACPNISGEYAARGEVIGEEEISASLNATLFRGWINWEKTTTILFSQPTNDTLNIQVHRFDGSSFAAELKKKRHEFYCTKESVIIELNDTFFEARKITRYTNDRFDFGLMRNFQLQEPTVYLSKKGGNLEVNDRSLYIDLAAVPKYNPEIFLNRWERFKLVSP